MQRWKITLEYDGAGFCGWQRQDNAPSVQQAVEEAIKGFSGESVKVTGSGRTDTGVHAQGQVAHFDLEKDTKAETVRDALNFYLKEKAVCVLAAEAVSEDFHARFGARQRHYEYHVINRRVPLVLDAARAMHVPRPLDDEAMRAAADLLVGQHDFSTFRAADCQSNSPIKTLDIARITRAQEHVYFWFSARSFLYHQVRNMVGTLVLVGTGQWSLADFEKAFAAHDRTKGGPTAPAHALTFMRVDYD